MPDREKIIAKLEKEVKRTYAIKTALFDGTEKVGEEITVHREPYVTLTIEMADKILALLKEQEHKDRMFHALEEDREKVIKNLEEVREYIRKGHDLASRKCRMMDKVTDALELLKEQEAVAKCDRCLFVARDRLRKVIETDVFKCPACKERIAGRMTDGTVLLETPGDDLPDYCPHCGQRLDWDIEPNDVAEGR